MIFAHQCSKFFCLALLVIAPGCVCLSRLPPVDLNEPGWSLRQGQAVWQADAGHPELAGEFLLATHSDGRAFVQFSKSPFPIVIGQVTSNRWQIEIPAQNRRYTGPGKPPARFSWLILTELVEGKRPRAPWIWQPVNALVTGSPAEGKRWRLENSRSGEWLEGVFSE